MGKEQNIMSLLNRTKLWMHIVGIAVAVVVIIYILETTEINQHIKELSNNATIIVEIAVGLTVAVIVYKYTKRDQDKTAETINNIRQVTAVLEQASYRMEKEPIKKNYDQLLELLHQHERLAWIYEEIEKTPLAKRNKQNLHDSMGTIKEICDLHNQLVDHTPVLHNERNLMRVRIVHDDLDIWYTTNNWEPLLRNLQILMNMQDIIKRHANAEKEKLDKLEANHKKTMQKL